MTTRRDVLTGAAAAGTMMAMGLPQAGAKAPMGGPQAPGFERFRIGAFEVIALHDGLATRDMPKGFVRNASDEDVAKAAAEVGIPAGKLMVSFTAVLVNTGDRVVLFDTGNAAGGTVGKLRDNLAAAGLSPDSVDAVVFSHFHGDHIGGLRNAEGALNFPKAEIMVPEAEWAFWMDDAKMSAAPEGMKGSFGLVRKQFGPDAAKVNKIAWGKEIIPGITAVQADGHTPGHTAYLVASGNDRMMFVGDITNHPGIFARRPDWQVMFDMDPEKAMPTRKRILDMAAADKIRLSFYHAPFPATGFAVKSGQGYDFVPALSGPA
jgi:glyoxylase-like metal-dependent hydrolase (beta-lactamase superfamily II)